MADPGSGAGGPDAASQAAGSQMGGQDRSGMKDTQDRYRAEKAYEATKEAIQKAKSTGKTVKTIENLGGGKFAHTDQFGNVNVIGPEQGGILGLIGYDPNKPLTENIYDMVVPGQNTPLGALSAVPGVLGASKTTSGILGLANTIAGKLGYGLTDDPTKSALSDSVIGEDSIIGDLGKMPQTGIASGTPAPTAEYTGRPDDAVKQSTPEVGSIFSAGGKNYIAGVNGPIALSGVPEQEVKSTPTAFSEGTLYSPDEMYGMLTGQLARPTSPYSTDYGLTGAPPTDESGIQNVSGDTSYLSQVQQGLQQLADNIVSIPGGYMDTETGMTYSGQYRKNPSARTITGRYTQDVKPFSFEALKQNLFGS